jgi:hypothetical protein
MICEEEAVAYFEAYPQYFTGRTEEIYENLRIGGLLAEI